MLGRLACREREQLTFGVRRANTNGVERPSRATFARVGELAHLQALANGKYHDIRLLPITEILDLQHTHSPRPGENHEADLHAAQRTVDPVRRRHTAEP
jgi:hypothetical protein